jgi:hypothetical protein
MPCGLKQKSYLLLRQKLYQDDETSGRPQRLDTGYTTVPVPLCKDKRHFIVLELRLYHANEEEVIVRDGHGGGWSRKINAWHLYTLMVYL